MQTTSLWPPFTRTQRLPPVISSLFVTSWKDGFLQGSFFLMQPKLSSFYILANASLIQTFFGSSKPPSFSLMELKFSSRVSIAKRLPFLKSSHKIEPTHPTHPSSSRSASSLVSLIHFSTLPPVQVALNACTTETLKLYVYAFCKNLEVGYGVDATDITSVKKVANSSLFHETSYRQATCISLSKALGLVSKYSPMYSSFEIFSGSILLLSAWLHSYG